MTDATLTPFLKHYYTNASGLTSRYRKVFSGYIAMRIKNAMRKAENGLVEPNLDFPGVEIGDVETVGDCRYAMCITDKNGTRYRVTVEVEPPHAFRDCVNGEPTP